MLNYLINRIYNFQHIGQFGYTQSDGIKPKRYSYLNLKNNLDEFEVNEIKNHLRYYFEDVDALGPFELKILDHITREFTNTVMTIIGGKGCGKTASIEFIYNFVKSNAIDKDPHKRPIAFLIDCNDILGYGDSNNWPYIYSSISGTIFHEIFVDYWEEISQLFTFHFINNQTHRKKSINNYLLFIKDSIPNKRVFVKDQLVKSTNEYLKTQRHEIQFKLAIDMIAELSTINKSAITFISLDNLDHMSPFLQEKMLECVLTIVNKSRIPFILPVRVITSRLDNIKNFVYPTIPHSGISPLREINRRTIESIKIMFFKQAEDKEIHGVTRKSKCAFALRAAELYIQFERNKEFNDLFHAIAGYSIQRGLSFIQRMFNSDDNIIKIIKYIDDADARKISKIITENEPELDFDTAMKKLYEIAKNIYLREGKKVPKDYHYMHFAMNECIKSTENYGPVLANIFDDPLSSRFNDIKYRILKLLNDNAEKKNKLIIKTVIKNLNTLGYDTDQIWGAIDYLHDPTRRLIWHTGKNLYEDFKALYNNSTQEIGITFSGKIYTTQLTSSLDYVAYMISKKKNEKIALLNQDLTIRITIAMRLIYEILNIEVDNYKEFENLKVNLYPHRNSEFKYWNLDNYMLAHLFSGALAKAIKILDKHRRKIKKQDSINHFEGEVNKVFDRHEGYIINSDGDKIPATIKNLKHSYKRIIDIDNRIN